MEQQVAFFLALVAGFIFGGAVVWMILRSDTTRAYDKAKAELTGELSKLEERISSKESRIEDLLRDREQLKAELEKQHKENTDLSAAKADLTARLAEAGKLAEEKLSAVTEAQEQLSHRFKALSSEALASNNQAFLNLAQQTMQRFQDGAKSDLDVRQQAIGSLVEPLRESLGKVDTSVRDILQSHAGVQEQVKMLFDAQNLLRTETSKLASTLRSPGGGGRWGELQLRRVVEMAGMEAHCDFDEQTSFENEAGRQRPDLIVHLPGRRQLAIDAKVSLKAYREAVEEEDPAKRSAKLVEHAAQVRSHLRRLGSKSYWAQLPETPEFVVAFLPGEAFFGAALQGDPELIEYGVEQGVILATPTTLIALLKAVAYGWRQERLADNAKEISALGKSLYQRLCTFTQHFESIRANLQRTVEGYNRAAGSLEARVMVSARRFQQLGAGVEQELPVLEPVDTFPRSLQAVEAAVSSIPPPVEPEDAQPELPGLEPEMPDSPELIELDQEEAPVEPAPDPESGPSPEVEDEEPVVTREEAANEAVEQASADVEKKDGAPPIIEWTAARLETEPADPHSIDDSDFSVEEPTASDEAAIPDDAESPDEEAQPEGRLSRQDDDQDAEESDSLAAGAAAAEAPSHEESPEPAPNEEANSEPESGGAVPDDEIPEGSLQTTLGGAAENAEAVSEPADTGGGESTERSPESTTEAEQDPSEPASVELAQTSAPADEKPGDDEDQDSPPFRPGDDGEPRVNSSAVNYLAFVKAM